MGYPFIFGFLKEKTTFGHLYVGLTYKQNFSDSRIFFFEIEAGYLGFNLFQQGASSENESHGIPFTASLLWRLELFKDFFFSPKIGLGVMVLYTKSETQESGFSTLIHIRPGLAFSYEISDNLLIVLEGTLAISQDINVSFGKKINYFLIPSLGMSYQF